MKDPLMLTSIYFKPERLPWPQLEHIRISCDVINKLYIPIGSLDNVDYRALTDLIDCVVSRIIGSPYRSPTDGSIPNDDKIIAKITGLPLRRWLKIRPNIEQFFFVENDCWHLAMPWISIDEKPARFAIPREIQKIILARQGSICTYCGDTGGPFEFDHILPVCRGGSNNSSNLTLACERCNRSKGGQTLQEWLSKGQICE